MDYTIELEMEADGRWIAEVINLPGVLTYGSTREEAIAKAQALALRVEAEKLEHISMPCLEVEQKEDAWADASFVAEMDRRTKEYESGTAKLFTSKEMENNARKAYKNIA